MPRPSFSHGCQPEKTTVHDGQSRSWSAEQGKENKRRSLAAYPPPTPHAARSEENKNKNHPTHLRALRRSRSVSRPHKDIFGSSTRHYRPNGCGFAKFYTPVCDNKFPSLVASLFSWRCLAASTSYFLHAAINLRPPSATALTHTSAFFNAVASQSPAMPNAQMSLWTQSVHSFSFPPRPLRTIILHPQGFRKRFASAADLS